jgi:uncharacterized membrane protein HdeD (DUF308 family)
MLFDSSLLLVRGLIGLTAGVLAFLWPGLTIAALVILFGFYAFIDGITNVFIGVKKQPGTDKRQWATLIQGIVGILAGVLTFALPAITALALLLLIGAWAIVTGVFEVAAAITLRKEIRGEWLLVLSGALSIAFGVILFIAPGVGAIGLAWTLGAYTAASGAVLVALGVRLRTHRTLSPA